ncbi:helix-turn-helix domain-containing protein [Haloechinothrix sp. LS1_15]|uniref:TetR/AcrR family transcriptional regulator n=1 Tax=Haloechinothrix sp. LS1_15 TaxID=2652248 RepID=UPI002945BA00|nr:helix-turn-helix domain-containing protein [Haloechinothrix sp. LS1_15]MDV6011250.1 TetR/AcrR family transcriptional regulator [Haloechinothrix sp. LS1_15]
MSTETVPRWRRLEPDERREQILTCAIRLFGERPYAAVSTSDVAREAGVARGLINHYFGSKRGLYLEVVRRMVMVSDHNLPRPEGSMRQKVESVVDWLLEAISAHGKTWVAVIGAEGVGDDPEVERILAEADERAAEYVVQVVGPGDIESHGEELRALIRAFGGMVKAAGREWITKQTLTREQVHLVLSRQLTHLIGDVFPQLRDDAS